MNFTKTLARSLKDIWSHRRLAATLAIRDTKAKYRSSFLGIFWAVFPPVAAAVGLATAKSAGVISLGETAIPYPAYVIFSMSLWQLFTTAITQPIGGLSGAKGLLTKVDFPREVIVLSEINKLLVFGLVQTVLIISVFLYFNVKVNSYFLLVFVPVLTSVLLGITISLLLAPFSLLYGDITSAMPIVIGGMFFITPVIYVAPEQGGIFSFFVHLNPMTTIMEFSRELLYSPTAPAFLPEFLIVMALTIPAACIALVFFRTAMPVVVERWSA
jgi:lipopolysaccharide transport system permease protein